MELHGVDIVVFVLFIVSVIAVGLYKSRGEGDSEDYFLAGRGLSWWLIGFSLIAANISTEQFVGMSGSAAGPLGLAIASYEWMAAITLVVVAFVFLPMFLRSGIYTIPEFLEVRYNAASRAIMAAFTMIIYVGVTIAAVVYSGALTIDTLFHGRFIFGFIPINVTTGAWIIGVIAAVYVASGGLRACAWADLIQGSALIVGGGVILYFALDLLASTPTSELATTIEGGVNLANDAGAWTKFFALNQDRLHMVLPADNPDIPWTALVVGLWIPNFYYWGLNQYITQRTLGSKSLAEGQKGVVFAAALKLIIPFVIVFPGMIAFNLFSQHMPFGDDGVRQYDTAFPLLIGRLLPSGSGLQGFVLAAILGAVVSSLASMLNSASTIFTMDLYRKYISPEATQKRLVLIGRACVVVFVIVGCLIAPLLGDPRFGGIFKYIQEFQGFISPGILAVFVFGLVVKKAPPVVGVVGLLLNPAMYGILKLVIPSLAFLDRMALSFFCVLAVMGIITAIKPAKKAFELPTNTRIDLDSSKFAKIFGGGVVVATVVLYIYFW
jgi:SSS family solute:Na+ symporter